MDSLCTDFIPLQVFHVGDCLLTGYHRDLHPRPITAAIFFNPMKYLITGAKDGCSKRSIICITSDPCTLDCRPIRWRNRWIHSGLVSLRFLFLPWYSLIFEPIPCSGFSFQSINNFSVTFYSRFQSSCGTRRSRYSTFLSATRARWTWWPSIPVARTSCRLVSTNLSECGVSMSKIRSIGQSFVISILFHSIVLPVCWKTAYLGKA